jgi:ParB family chromosome partitioning protein
MSIKNKAAAIDFSAAPTSQPDPIQTHQGEAPAKTGPGILNSSMVAQRVLQLSEMQQQVEKAQAALKEFDGASPTRLLDPIKVLATRWANRHQNSFKSAAFAQLKKEIAEAGGNVQPIKVRKTNRVTEEFEIVFGHRRHRACLELGLPVLAMVVEIDDVSLWKEMEHENRARSDLSPWEQGLMYKRALDEGLFPSRRKLADSIGVDHSQVAKVVGLTELPTHVIEAFASPTDIQVNWVSALRAAIDRDPDTVQTISQSIKSGTTKCKGPRAVLKALTSPPGEVPGVEPFHTERILRGRAGRPIGTIKSQKDGTYLLELALPEATIDDIERALMSL